MPKTLKQLGEYCIMLGEIFSKPENIKMYWKEFIHQCIEIGVRSIPIVVIISMFLGAVTTVQTQYQLISPLVPKAIIAKVVRDSIMLELSPTIMGLVLAGVVGSRIAGELGNMRLTEQIDTIEMMGINSKKYLILPKLLAALYTIPLLIIISIFLAIWSGREVGSLSGILSTHTFDAGLRNKFNSINLLFALLKAYTFSFIISTIPGYFGYYAKGGAVGIGKASTKAVVVSCVMILICDYTIASML